ncbi:hypothetical protein SLA2020_505170 [Shorea laevis]
MKDMRYWDGDVWQWKMEWKRACMGREVDEEERFWSVLSRARLTKGGMDKWKWVHNSNGDYTVKATYNFLSSIDVVLEKKWCKLIWGRYIPSKVSIFGWRLLLNRLATKENIFRRG